jgi:hypothetical protein
MTGPVEPEPGRRRRRSPDDSDHPVLVAGRARRATLHPVRGRWVALSAVVATVTVVAVIAAALPTSAPGPAPGLADGVAVPPSGAYSSSAFCPTGAGTAPATIFLTNSSPAIVSGVMTSVGQPGASAGTVPTVRRTVAVPARGTAAVDPAKGLPSGSTATSFVFDGGGVVASQAVTAGGSWSTAPCASQPSAQWSFAGGSTVAGNSLSLSLFNPSSTEAVVDISFLTGSGRITPQSYQGLVVPAGQLVVENVGDYVQNASAVATFVVAQSGTLVASQFQQWSSGPTGGVSLQLGAPALSDTWRFAQTTVEPKSTVDFTLANPGSSSVTASVLVGLPSGTVVPRQVVVPPESTQVFAASSPGGLPRSVPCSVTVESAVPLVVGRAVQAPAGTTPPEWGASIGTVTAATGWVVPGPGVPGAPGTVGATATSLALANPGPNPVRVKVALLGSGRTVAMVTVGPGRLTVLGPKVVGGLAVLTVTAAAPVFVEEDSDPTGAPGVVSSTGFPVAG